MKEERPLADSARIEAALRMFPFRELSPEQFAARWSHTILLSSFDQYRYPDMAMESWIDELHRLLRSPAELERCRRAHLSAEDYAAVQDDITAEHGL
jgi:hypothetical protein